MQNIKNNINNLTNLWKIVSQPYEGYAGDDTINYSLIQASEWPNKIWASHELTPEILQTIKSIVENSKIKLRFVDFEYDDIINRNLIESFGFQLTSSLTGMHLTLTEPFDIKKRLNLVMVTNRDEAKIWCNLFKQSFGYVISEDLVVKSLHKVSYYLAFENGIPIGTIKLHHINKVAGIYSLGIPPNFRGKGYAKEMMHLIINRAIQLSANLATLQASQQALVIYKQLGFKTDFFMNSYELKTQ